MLFSLKQFLKYYFISVTKFKVHSPFVFSFIQQILEKEIDYNKNLQVEKLINNYKKNNLNLKNEDYGAGSKVNKKDTISIKHLLKNVATSKKYGKVLNNIVNYYKLENCIELGTSLGIGTTFLSSNFNTITTIEGNKDLAALTENQLSKIGINNIRVLNDEFDNILTDVLNESSFDLLFIDGNHTKKSTLKYFDLALKYKTNNSVIIFDDINWSKGMNEAWNKIKNTDEVMLSIDLFKFGIVFFNKDFVTKEHFVLWY